MPLCQHSYNPDESNLHKIETVPSYPFCLTLEGRAWCAFTPEITEIWLHSPETNLQPTPCLMLHWLCSSVNWLLTKLWTKNKGCLLCLSFSPSDWHVLVAPLPVAMNPECALPEPSLYFAAWMLCELQNISLPGVMSVQFHELQILHKPDSAFEGKKTPPIPALITPGSYFLPYFDVRPSCFFPLFLNFQL